MPATMDRSRKLGRLRDREEALFGLALGLGGMQPEDNVDERFPERPVPPLLLPTALHQLLKRFLGVVGEQPFADKRDRPSVQCVATRSALSAQMVPCALKRLVHEYCR